MSGLIFLRYLPCCLVRKECASINAQILSFDLWEIQSEANIVNVPFGLSFISRPLPGSTGYCNDLGCLRLIGFVGILYRSALNKGYGVCYRNRKKVLYIIS